MAFLVAIDLSQVYIIEWNWGKGNKATIMKLVVSSLGKHYLNWSQIGAKIAIIASSNQAGACKALGLVAY